MMLSKAQPMLTNNMTIMAQTKIHRSDVQFGIILLCIGLASAESPPLMDGLLLFADADWLANDSSSATNTTKDINHVNNDDTVKGIAHENASKFPVQMDIQIVDRPCKAA
eukprot:scaffold162744_cov24-Prasinocladus_malaysianus.AAC.1